MKTHILLLALLCTFYSSSPPCEATISYVKPTEPHNSTCPCEPCYTLDEYVSNSTTYFRSNTVFMFLSGHHSISYDLNISNVHNITLKPYMEKGYILVDSELVSPLVLIESVSDIVISGMTFHDVYFKFENCKNVMLTGLTSVNRFIHYDYLHSILLSNVSGVVNISQFKCAANCNSCVLQMCIGFNYPSQYTSDTEILLHEFDLNSYYSWGVHITGYIPGNISIINSTFSAADTAIFVYSESVTDSFWSDKFFICKNTRFYRTPSYFAQNDQLYRKHTIKFAFYNVSYIDSEFDDNPGLFFSKVHSVTIHNCHFKKSYIKAINSMLYLKGSVTFTKSSRQYVGGAITAINTVLSFINNITFTDNHSLYRGGAISLLGDSYIFIPEPQNTYVLFENNTADDVGGAIFSNSITYESEPCRVFSSEENTNKTVFNFSMNTAVNGGNTIYGAYLSKHCYSPDGTPYLDSLWLINASYFTPSFSNDPSVISSDALKLCYCNEDGKLGNCSGTLLSVYPGQVFELSVAVLGDNDGLVKWPVHAVVHSGEFSNEIQHTQITNAKSCTSFYYSVLSNETSAKLEFKLSFDISEYHSVHLLDCPLGFTLSSNYGCDCHWRLQNIESITCNITEQSIQRQDTTWIGVLNKTSDLAFSTVCPLAYCKTAQVKIQTNDFLLGQDNQCTGNHSGVLCGGCRDNFSLALGSNRCLSNCSNVSFSLITAFAVAGIALVLFIKIFNMTVSQGTINGLIFYANIAGAEQTMLFSSQACESFLSVFIAWLNLDVGIEICFFNGMDAYAKAWLQFVFPAYVWAIALFIIILSHYSIRVSKVFGNNSVPVLATLILLSYSKLIRAVISALSVINIYFLNGSAVSVWERDGNIQYLTGKHIPLFAFALAVLVLLWLPFTLVLISIQLLQKGTHYRVLCWVTKLMPFFDAFTGPLKSKHRYWIGALLLVRCFLLLVFYIDNSSGSGVSLIAISFAILAVIVFLAATGSVYRHYYTSGLELSYFLNLGVLAIGTLYVRYISGGSQTALTVASVGIVFLQFLATVIYHTWVQLDEPLRKLKVKILGKCIQVDVENHNGSEHAGYEHLDGASYGEQSLQRTRSQEIDFREPLLGYM